MQLKKCLFLSVSLFLVIFILFYKSNLPINDVDRSIRLKKIDEFIRNEASSLACKQPKLPIYSHEIMKFIHDVPPIDCKDAEMDWVKCDGSECYIQEQIKLMYGPIKCSFTDIIRLNDYDLTDGETTHSDSYYKLEKSDVVRVSCKGEWKKWSHTLVGIRQDKDILERSNWDDLPENSIRMNILMFGFDSLSRNSFIRKLPQSYNYMKNVLNAHILEGYNIVGDGTPQALIPILTGKTELELPDTRKRLPNTKFVNSYPFIWNDFEQAGYVTGFFEDVPDLGTFTYRLNGFDKVPTDHYMRTYYLAAFNERNKWPKYCAGDKPRHQVMFNQIKNFFKVYRTQPKFLFAFHGELSHDDYNLIGAADRDMYEFLKNLKLTGALDNTILIIMADHGHRFAEIRNTLQGKQEERLPFFSFRFPEKFFKLHKTAYKNFLSNINKLTTPFDIYTTLKSVLNLDNVGMADITKRSVSLFSMIPEERSCANAYIEPHWCACLDWFNVPLDSSIIKDLSTIFINTLNNATSSYRNHCELLKIAQVDWVTKLIPNRNLLKFNKNADFDGFVADLSAKMTLNIDNYQIKIIVIPGNSIFEGSIMHYIQTNTFEMSLSDVSRINMYGKQARCIEDTLPDLRKYCFCKD